jgi:hypothetical protein
LGHIRGHAHFKEEQEDPYLREQVEYGLDLDDIQKARAYENARRNFAEHGRKAKKGKDLGRRPGGYQDDEKLEEETGDIHGEPSSKIRRKKDRHPKQLFGWRPDHPRDTPGMRDPRTLENLLYGYE